MNAMVGADADVVTTLTNATILHQKSENGHGNDGEDEGDDSSGSSDVVSAKGSTRQQNSRQLVFRLRTSLES